MNMKEQTALWLGIQDLKYEIYLLRGALEEISRGSDSNSQNYSREDMIRLAKEALEKDENV